MSIAFPCNTCGKPIKLPDSAAGRMFRCKSCSTVQQAPGDRAADSLVEELDLSQMLDDSGPASDTPFLVAASTETAAPFADAPQTDPGEPGMAVDWNAIAPPLRFDGEPAPPPLPLRGPPAVPSMSPARALTTPLPLSLSPTPPPALPSKRGRFDHYMIDAVLALPTSVVQLPQIVGVLLIGLGAYAISTTIGFFIQLVPQSARSFELTYLALALIATPYLLYLGYLTRFWLQVTDAASYGEAGGLPDSSISDLAKSLLLWLLFALVYVAPIITLPLAPVAFLALARTGGCQAFHLPWVARETGRSLGYVVVIFVFAPLFVGAGLWIVRLVMLAVFEGTPRPTTQQEAIVLAWKASTVLALVGMPTMHLVMAAVCRIVGLIGLHRPAVYASMPARGNLAEALGMGAGGAVVTYYASPVIVMAILYFLAAGLYQQKQPEDLVQGRTNELDFEPSNDPSLYLPPSLPVVRDGGRERSMIPVPREPLVEPDPAFTARPELVRFYLRLLNDRDFERRIRGLQWLTVADPLDSVRAEVLKALDSMPEAYGTPSTMACYDRWADDTMSPLLRRLRKGTQSDRAEAVARLAAMEPVEQHRAAVAAELARLLNTDPNPAAAFDAFLRWSNNPEPILIAELQRRRPYQSRIIEELGKSKSPQTASALLRVLRNDPRQLAALKPVLIAMPVEAKVEEAAAAVLGDDSVVTAALSILEAVGTARSAPALKAITRHDNDGIADAAERVLMKIAPDQWTPVDSALMVIDTTMQYNRSRVGGGLRKLAEITPTDADRPRVLTVLKKLLETADSNIPPDFARAMGRWADEAMIDALIVRLSQTQNYIELSNLMAVLTETGNKKVIKPIVDRFIDARQPAMESLAKLGRPAEEYVLDQLRGRDTTQRINAARILREIGTNLSLPSLVTIGKAKTIDATLRSAARSAAITIQAREKK